MDSGVMRPRRRSFGFFAVHVLLRSIGESAIQLSNVAWIGVHVEAGILGRATAAVGFSRPAQRTTGKRD